MQIPKKQVKELREAAILIGNRGAYSSKAVVMLCDDLLEAWKQLEAAERLANMSEEAKRAVC